MPDFVTITDPEDPRLAVYRDLTDAQLQARQGLFMAEGELVVRVGLTSSPYHFQSVLLTAGRAKTLEADLQAFSGPVYLVEPAIMDQVTGFHIHRGVLAAGIRPGPRSPHDLAARAHRLLILEDLANHDNVGGLFRVAAAFGVDGVLLSPRCCDPLYRKAIRVSMGHALRIPFATCQRWPEDLSTLRAGGWAVLALATGASSESLDRRFSCAESRIAVLVGAEGPGLSDVALAQASRRLRIPMAPGVDSLNVVVAAGVALHRIFEEPDNPSGL